MLLRHIQHTNNMKSKETTEEKIIIEAREDMLSNVKYIGEGVVEIMHPVTSHNTVRHI